MALLQGLKFLIDGSVSSRRHSTKPRSTLSRNTVRRSLPPVVLPGETPPRNSVFIDFRPVEGVPKPASVPPPVGLGLPINTGPAMVFAPTQVTLDPQTVEQIIQHPPTLLTGTGGGGKKGSGGTRRQAAAPITWAEKYQLEGAPSWWKGLVPSRLTPETELAAIMNALIPFMSPEDQRTAAQSLARNFPDAFGIYNPLQVDFGTPPPEITTEIRDRFLAADRARRALQALQNMAGAMGKSPKDFGPGFAFLQQVLDVIRDFGGGGSFLTPGTTQHATRQNLVRALSALDPLLAETKGGPLAAFGPLARMVAQPFFSGGLLVPVRRTRTGEFVFGQPNPRFFI